MREQPPYLHIVDVLRQRIADQEWAPGDRLPSRAQLAQECKVGEAVIRRAQETLIAQGVWPENHRKCGRADACCVLRVLVADLATGVRSG
ncbi:GntR family transcriptional regulator, partial [Streptomyces sp. NPDC004227]